MKQIREVFNIRKNKKQDIDELKCDYDFKKLSPTKDANISIYEDALNFVFKNDEIKNVAISGAYCSGKSSIMESYEEKYKENFKLLHISLAHFSAVEQSDGKKGKSAKKRRASIESKILNQLIQQIPFSRIKLTKFKIKKNAGTGKAIWLSVLLCVFAALLLHILKFHAWKYLVWTLHKGFLKQVLLYTCTPEARIVSAVLLLVIVGIVIFKLVFAQYTNSFIRKISFQGNEIDIGHESEDSFFDKYLNEVLYIFEETDAAGIVFEDIDRFNDLALFERLREINTLVNIRKKNKKKNNQPLRFFYMLRDDIFIEFKDRTKFFDFIIPIIPVVDSSNSFNVMKKYIEDARLGSKIEDYFLRAVSLYIDDLRLLKNIMNEFVIYSEKLKFSKLELDNLLAIIIYKNIFPGDYDDLRLNKGYVYSVISSEAQIKNAIRTKLADDEEAIRADYLTIKKAFEVSLVELDKERSKKRNETLTDQNLEQHNKWLIFDYFEKRKLIESRYSDECNELDKKINAIINTRDSIDNTPFNELLSNYSDIVFHPDFFKKTNGDPFEITKSHYFRLLRFLIAGGYIDQTYPEYMTYHYEGGLTIDDKIFIRSVIERDRMPFDYSIESPELIIEAVEPYYFSRPEMLNFDIYDYIFAYDITDLINFALEAYHNSPRDVYFAFVEGYVLNGKRPGPFINLLVKNKKRIIIDAYGILSHEALEKLSELMIKECKSEDLKLLSFWDEKPAQFIASLPYFLSIDINSSKLCSALKAMNVVFKEIYYEYANRDVFNYIYYQDLYELNEKNILLMLNTQFKGININDTLRVFFSFAYNNIDKPLCKYSLGNISMIMPKYLALFDGPVKDESTVATKVINNCSYESATLYINRLTTEIVDVDVIKDKTLIPLILKRKCIEINTSNLLACFKTTYRIDAELADIINLKYDYSDIDINDDLTRLFLIEVLKSKDIRNNVIVGIIHFLGDKSIQLIDKADIPEKRMRLVFDTKFIGYSVEVCNIIRDSYPNLLDYYIDSVIEDYIANFPSPLVESELDIILSSKKVKRRNKIRILEKNNKVVSLVNKSYPLVIMGYICDHYFDAGDIGWFAENYSRVPERIQKKIASLIVNYPWEIYKINNEIEHKLKLIVLSSEKISYDHRVRYLSMYLDDIEKEEMCELLLALGAEKIAREIISGENFKVDVDSMNRRILKVLWKKHIIEYPEVTKSGKYYKKLQYIPKDNRPCIHLNNNTMSND